MVTEKKNKDLVDELKNRKNKLKILKSKGIAFPNDFVCNFNAKELHKKFGKFENEKLKKINLIVNIAGRMITKRIMGKASFVTIQDSMGSKIQLYISSNYLSNEDYNDFKTWDLGDILAAHGHLFKTKTEELSVNCKNIRILVKSLKPLPDKFYGLSDKEMSYRKRYLDLIVNNKSLKKFRIRSKIIFEIRKFMSINNFIEVETPMMHKIPGGASARPFITHHNNLKMDMYLRISPELYLKRLIIGGFEKIFEINRNFRNEGISPYHNPEFTMMELYVAYANYNDLLKLIEKLFLYIVNNIFKKDTIYYNDEKINFSKPFNILTMKNAILTYKKQIKENDLENYNKISLIAKKLNIKIDNNWCIGKIIAEIFEKDVKHLLLQPTFITEYPIAISPLSRRNDKKPDIADRFELFIGGIEICNGFSELNDADDQLKRFIDQKEKDDNEKKQHDFNKKHNIVDYDYIEALKYGLPPTAGLGIGIDRMIMILTNSKTIKDVILFPTLKPKLFLNFL